MAETEDPGTWTALANRTAPKGRAPTAGEAWRQRALRAKDRLAPQDARRCRRFESELLTILGQKETIIDGRWAPNPNFRSAERERELWTEIGELLGIGEPPAGWGIVANEADTG